MDLDLSGGLEKTSLSAVLARLLTVPLSFSKVRWLGDKPHGRWPGDKPHGVPRPGHLACGISTR